MSVKETLTRLVSIDSVSARSNAEIISYLEERCRALGFSVRRYPYKDEAGVEKINLVCIAGSDSSAAAEVELVLVGHTDTVPYDPNWTEATTLTERDGKLYGRGACDTKGFIAAALTAIEVVGTDRLRRPLGMVFTADEEVGLLGAKKLAALAPFRAHNSIVGEPTSLQPIHAGKGYCLAEILVKGSEGHSAYPALGRSAVFRAARLISRLEKIAEELKEEQHPGFDPPYTTLNVGLIRGGSAKNVIAGECRFTLEWRPIPGQPAARLLEHLEQAIDAEKIADPDFECEVDASRSDTGFETPRDSRIVKLLEEETGKSAGSVAFGTEAAQMTQLGAAAVVLGPGDIRVAHRTGEYVATEQLEKCVKILRQAIEHLCL
jgi:acetylornithine deacetylase